MAGESQRGQVKMKGNKLRQTIDAVLKSVSYRQTCSLILDLPYPLPKYRSLVGHVHKIGEGSKIIPLTFFSFGG